jgi:hypothetical protein
MTTSCALIEADSSVRLASIKKQINPGIGWVASWGGAAGDRDGDTVARYGVREGRRVGEGVRRWRTRGAVHQSFACSKAIHHPARPAS